MTWTIDKQFSFCYGHRVWSQELIGEYCESGDACCKCRHLHGHEGLVHVFLEGDELTRGMVTDFKHLGWLKNFLDDNLDHKFIIDRNDPWFENIINGKIIKGDWTESQPDGSTKVVEREMLLIDETAWRVLLLEPVYVPGTEHLAGYNLNVSRHVEGAEQEFYEGFFIVDFLPTSENLAKYLYDCVKVKMDKIGVNVAKITWNETPKSRAEYSG